MDFTCFTLTPDISQMCACVCKGGVRTEDADGYRQRGPMDLEGAGRVDRGCFTSAHSPNGTSMCKERAIGN